jgi:N-acetylneuraminic acid mutarotase
MKKNILALILILSSFTYFGQTENFWLKKNDFSGWKRERAVGFSIGDYGYLCSGVDTAEMVVKDLWQYDPVLDVWSQKADLPGSARRDAIAFTIDNIGYVGTGIDNDEAAFGQKLNDFWAYDPNANTWSQKADFPGDGGLGIYFASAFGMGSKGYVCGGKSNPNSYSKELWEYKPNSDSWSQRADFPGGVRYQMCSFSIGLKGYVGLGADKDIYKKDLWEFDGGTNQWTQKANLPSSARGSASSFAIGLRGFICLGTNGGLLGDLWEFNPFSNSWVVRAAFGGSERKNAMSFSLNNKGYVGTGKGYSGKKGSIYEYTPNNFNFTIYPNPAIDHVTLSFDGSGAESVSVYSLQAELFMEKAVSNAQNIDIRMDGLSKGWYLIVVKDAIGNSIGTKKILIE